MSKELVVMGKPCWVKYRDGNVVEIIKTTTTHTYHEGPTASQIGNVITITGERRVPFMQTTAYKMIFQTDTGEKYGFDFNTYPSVDVGERATVCWGAPENKKVGRPLFILNHKTSYIHSYTGSFLPFHSVMFNTFTKRREGIAGLMGFIFISGLLYLGYGASNPGTSGFLNLLLWVFIIALFFICGWGFAENAAACRAFIQKYHEKHLASKQG